MEQSLILSISREELMNLISEAVSEGLVQFTKEQDKNKLNLPDLATKEDLVKLFHVSKGTINNWDKKGLIPRIKTDRGVRYRRDDIENALSAGNLKKYGRTKVISKV